MKFKVDGLDKVLRELKKMETAAPKVIQEAIRREAYRVDRESVKQVPVDTGRLRSTHIVTENHGLRTAGAVVTYGGGTGVSTAVHYAREVHDDERARHSPGQKARFLIDPLIAAKPGFIDRVVRYIRKELKI